MRDHVAPTHRRLRPYASVQRLGRSATRRRTTAFWLLLAIGDDNYYTMEGSGLERNLPTSDLSALWERVLEPDFADKKYSEASVKYFDALFKKVATSTARTSPSTTPQAPPITAPGEHGRFELTSNGARRATTPRARLATRRLRRRIQFPDPPSRSSSSYCPFLAARGAAAAACRAVLAAGLGGSMFGSGRRRPPGPGPGRAAQAGRALAAAALAAAAFGGGCAFWRRRLSAAGSFGGSVDGGRTRGSGAGAPVAASAGSGAAALRRRRLQRRRRRFPRRGRRPGR